MNELFKTKQVSKTYWAITKNLPPQQKGTLKNFLKKNNERNKSYVVKESTPQSKHAILHYECIGSGTNYHVLKIMLETGRHHQIRVQLANIGCPIKGDLKYGFPRSNPDASICLHSQMLSFIHPVSKEPLNIRAEPKGDIWDKINITES